jgi:inosine/xanthosine triphosphatase
LRELLLGTNRLKADEEALFIGLEGGVFQSDFSSNKRELWSTVWAAVLDQDEKLFLSNGARFPLPEFLSEMLLAGQEMGPSLGKLVGEENLRQKEGMIGYLTNNFTNRTDEYASIAKVAIGLWYGSQTL